MSEFIGRAPLVAELWTRLRHMSVLLVGPRRVGKSRLLEEMRGAPPAGRELVRVDLQGATSPEHLLVRLREQLGTSGGTEALKRVQSVNALGVGVSLNAAVGQDLWAEVRSTILARPAPPNEEAVFVIALDEVPWWLDAIERQSPGGARTVLAELRRLRGEQALAHVRWVLTGSVGIATRAGRWHASAELNDLDVVEAPPLDAAAGAALFETDCLANGVHCDPAAATLAHVVSGGRPHWIRTLAERACAAVGGHRVTSAVVEAEVARLLSPQHRHLFQEEGEGHFGREYTEAEVRGAAAVLNVLAAVPPGEATTPRLGVLTAVMAQSPGTTRVDAERVVRRLVEEFYVTEVGDDLVLSVPLFGRWWARWGGR